MVIYYNRKNNNRIRLNNRINAHIVDRRRLEVGREKTTVVIGAGPYGLSSAAHIKSKGIQTHVFGKPMEFWQNMPLKCT